MSFYQFGVCKALFDQNCLPNIISGTSGENERQVSLYFLFAFCEFALYAIKIVRICAIQNVCQKNTHVHTFEPKTNKQTNKQTNKKRWSPCGIRYLHTDRRRIA